MKNLVSIIFLLFAFTAFAQQEPIGPPDWDTTHIQISDGYYYLISDAKWFDSNGALLYRDPKEILISTDSINVVEYLNNVITTNVTLEADGVRSAFEHRKIGSEAVLLEDFTGMPFWQHSTLDNIDFFTGFYTVRLVNTDYSAVIDTNTNGALQLNISTIGTYQIRPQGINKIEVRNFEGTGDHTFFYFVKKSKGRRIYANKDFNFFIAQL